MFGKTFTRILNIWIHTRAEREGKLSTFQAVFKKKYCTMDHIFILHTLVKKQLSQQKGSWYTCCVNLNKAFDFNKIQLIRKLGSKRISKKTSGMLKAILKYTTFRVKIERKMKTSAFQNIGMKPGCQASPRFVYISMILKKGYYQSDMHLIRTRKWTGLKFKFY